MRHALQDRFGLIAARRILYLSVASAPMLMNNRDDGRGGLSVVKGGARYFPRLVIRRARIVSGRPCVVHGVFDRVALALISMGRESRQGVNDGGLEVIKELRSGAAKGQH